MEYNRVLKQHGKLYIEVPCPGTDRKHEYNLNHYSILGDFQLAALLERTGFGIIKFDTIEFDIETKNPDPNISENIVLREKFFCVLVTKQRPLDIK